MRKDDHLDALEEPYGAGHGGEDAGAAHREEGGRARGVGGDVHGVCEAPSLELDAEQGEVDDGVDCG